MTRPQRYPEPFDVRRRPDPHAMPPLAPDRPPAARRRRYAPKKHVKIPTHWEPAEALSVVAFLERIIAAISRQHGPAVADFLRRSEENGSASTLHSPPMHFDLEEEDPF
jgi:hypothetical protein